VVEEPVGHPHLHAEGVAGLDGDAVGAHLAVLQVLPPVPGAVEEAVLGADDELLAPHLVLAAAPPHPADMVELADRLEGGLDGCLRVEGQAEQILVVAGGEVDGTRVGPGVRRFGTHGRAQDGDLQGEQRHGGPSERLIRSLNDGRDAGALEIVAEQSADLSPMNAHWGLGRDSRG